VYCLPWSARCEIRSPWCAPSRPCGLRPPPHFFRPCTIRFGSVRVGAVLSLVNLRVPRPTGQDGEYFDRARQEYIARAAIQPDDGAEQFTLGGFQLFSGEPAAAVISLENSLRLDPTLPARYFLAGAWLELNKPEEAVKTLRSTPPADPYFAAARRMLSVLKK
jgi:tetratricopeptide (TPR) repeat protein